MRSAQVHGKWRGTSQYVALRPLCTVARQTVNERLLKDVLWLLAVMTACGVLALAISTVLGVPAKYFPRRPVLDDDSRLRRLCHVDQAAPVTITLKRE